MKSDKFSRSGKRSHKELVESESEDAAGTGQSLKPIRTMQSDSQKSEDPTKVSSMVSIPQRVREKKAYDKQKRNFT